MADLAGKVQEWLERTGFPLEMSAAAAFRSAGFDVTQSGSYSDPEMNKGREIDVLARDPDLFGAVEINYVVECKSSPKPWVLLKSADAFPFGRWHAIAVMSEVARAAMISKLQSLNRLQQYVSPSKEGGYALRQAFCNGEDAAYTATINVLKACQSIHLSLEKNPVRTLHFIFPVIVVDSPIFECSLDQSGRLQLKEVEGGEFRFLAHIPEHVGSSISVVKKTSLVEFASSARAFVSALRLELKEEEQKLIAAWSK